MTDSLNEETEKQVKAKLIVRLYADDTLVAETDNEIIFCASLNRIMSIKEPRE